MDKRVIRISRAGAPPKKIAPVAPSSAPLVNAAPRRTRGIPFPVFILILLALGGAAGVGFWKYSRRPKAPAAATTVAPSRTEQTPRQTEAPPDTAVVPETPVEAPRQETALDILRQDERTREAVWTQIEAARKDPGVTTLSGFGGIKFGEVQSGSPVQWGTVSLGGETGTVSKITCAVWGPKLAKPFRTFGAQPIVWVTPKTRQAYRIELVRPLVPSNGVHEAETEQTVKYLETRFKRSAFVTWPMRPGRPDCEFAIPLGDVTVRVGEYDQRLKLIVEHEAFRRKALEEAESVRAASPTSENEARLLDATRYPQGEMGTYPRLRFKESSPRSFCGLVFGMTPPPRAVISDRRNGVKSFYLDYAKVRIPAFRGFTCGRAELDRRRGGLYAVHLFSEGGFGGLNDADYFEDVKNVLAAHYRVQPEVLRKDGTFPELLFRVGDVAITLGPDPDGGFFLRAEQTVLAELAKKDPSEGKGKAPPGKSNVTGKANGSKR